MNIIGITAENVKKLKLVQLQFDPKKPIVIISGRNEQGKSTLMDCVEYAMSGGKALKDVEMPIRKGEDHAKVIITTDELIVTRTWTAAGNTYLTVTNKDGWKPSGGAQELLDKLYSSFSFDPLAFSQMKDDKQLEILLKLVKIPIDLNAWAKDRKKIFDERTSVNRDVTDLEGQLKLMVDVPADTPDEELSAAAVLEEQAWAQAVRESNEAARRALENHNQEQRNKAAREREDIQRSIDLASDSELNAREKWSQNNEEIARLQKELSNKLSVKVSVEKDISENETIKFTLMDVLGNMPDLVLPDPESLGLVDPDMTVFAKRISDVEETNRLVRIKKKHQEILTNLSAKKLDADGKTATLLTMDKKKSDALTAAKFPIDGLSFTDTGIIYDGIPFGQCSSAEKLRVSTAMGMAMNPKLKAMFIRDASLLDRGNKSMIEHMAQENGFMVFMEIMDESGKLGIVIEDGEVKSIDGQPFKLEADKEAEKE